MAHRTVATILILITTMILALPAMARQNVAPTFRSACADVAASLSVSRRTNGGVKPPLRHADLKVSGTVAAVSDRRSAVGTPPLQKASLKGGPAMPANGPAKPFTQEQVSNMVRDGFGDESGAKLIEQRGIDFAPSEDFYQTLKAAGASEAFLKALRAAKPPEPASAKKPLNQVQVFALLAGQVPSHRVTMLVQERGIDFEPTDDYLQEVRLGGGFLVMGVNEQGVSSGQFGVLNPETVQPAVAASE